MPTAIIYTRVSTTEQAESGTSLNTQESACRSWADDRGFDVAALFSDAGESAKTADRPQLLALIAWCVKHKPDVCVVWKFDRWARNATDHAVAAAAIAKHGTRLVSATEAASDDPAGRLLQTILSGIAQFDNEVRGERSRVAMRNVAMRGGWFTTVPFGFLLTRSGNLPILVEDQEHAPLIRDLFEGLAFRRRNLAQTVAVAREHDIPETRVRKMLRSPIYAGIIRSTLTGGRDIVAAFPGLVTRETWLAAQDAMKGRVLGHHAKQRPEFPLRGILRCCECSHPVTACFSRGRTRRYAYYQCPHGHVRARTEAVHASWGELLQDASALYGPLLATIKEQIREKLHERIDAMHAVERDALSEASRLRGRRSRLLDAFLAGALDQRTFAERDANMALRIQAAEDASRKKTDWGIDLESTIAAAMSILDDPASVWERIDVSRKQRFATALFGDGLSLHPDGKLRTVATGGIAGALSMLGAADLRLAPPRGVEPLFPG